MENTAKETCEIALTYIHANGLSFVDLLKIVKMINPAISREQVLEYMSQAYGWTDDMLKRTRYGWTPEEYERMREKGHIKPVQETYSLLVHNIGWVEKDNPEYGAVKVLYNAYVKKGHKQVSLWSSNCNDPIAEYDVLEEE